MPVIRSARRSGLKRSNQRLNAEVKPKNSTRNTQAAGQVRVPAGRNSVTVKTAVMPAILIASCPILAPMVMACGTFIKADDWQLLRRIQRARLDPDACNQLAREQQPPVA